jgi:hypothetical protein
MNDFDIVFKLGRWRVIAWGKLIASYDTEKEAKVEAARIQENPGPLRSYLGLKD